MSSYPVNIAFIGFGEAAGAFWSSMDHKQIKQAKAYDIKTDSADNRTRESMLERYQQSGMLGCTGLQDALHDTQIVLSLVTANQAHRVATEAAALLEDGAFFLDCNSCAPQTKISSASAFDPSRTHYVDVAIMSPVYPSKNRTPLLLSGGKALAAADILNQLDMNASVEAGDIGRASSIKMIRSIMVKGMEALFAECALAGRLAGVDDEVFSSLDASFPGFDSARRANYNLERMIRHGRRRAAEMEEVCHFLDFLGIHDSLSERTAEWQKRIGELQLTNIHDDYKTSADEIIQALNLKQIPKG